MIDPHFLLAELKYVMDSMPVFPGHETLSPDELDWLGRVHSLVSRWNKREGMAVGNACDFFGIPGTQAWNLNKIKAAISRAIADLELQIRLTPPSNQGVFGPGAVYEFFKALSSLIATATRSIFIIDPYLDGQVFDAYLSPCQTTIGARLLVMQYVSSVKAGAATFSQQHQMTVEIRRASNFHDRVIFIDEQSCWVLGQSIKDAAKTKVTYLAPLSSDLVASKLKHYEAIWLNATPL